VSDQYSTSQIICINTANGVNATITFNVGKKLGVYVRGVCG
jgi:hypothetical protein